VPDLDHPDHEQLAALQAGDGDRRQRARVAEHVAGCPACAEVVAAVERARGGLALLGEPELPAGLHDRLAGTVAAEAARAGPRRPPAWYRRPAAWAAAAALLLAAIAVPLLGRSGGGVTTASRGAGGAGQTAAAPQADTAAAGVPVLRLAEEITPQRLHAALARDPAAMQAFGRAAAEAARGNLKGEAQAGGRQTAPTPAPPAASGGAASPGGAARSGGAATSGGAQAGPAVVRACLAAAVAQAGRELVPAFVAEGRFRGRPATVLVTATAGDPTRAELWAFPAGDCSGPPLARQRVK
jgi:hypothetical protein